MKTIGSLGCSDCCHCSDCCGGTSPDEMDVELYFERNGWTDPTPAPESCGRCHDFFSGMFTLVRAGGCDWNYIGYSIGNSDINQGDCDDLSDPDAYLDTTRYSAKELEIRYSVRCIDSTHYRLELYVIQKLLLYPTYPIADPAPPANCFDNIHPVWIENWHRFYDDVPSSGWSCTGNNRALTYRGMECFCYAWPVGAAGGICATEFKACVPAGDEAARITPGV